MFGWFSKPALPSAEDVEWVLDTYAWMIHELGGFARFDEAPLVLPTRDYFAVTEVETHARAQAIFARILEHAGLHTWPFELVQQEKTPRTRDLMGDYAYGRGAPEAHEPAGTHRFDAHRQLSVVTYAPGELDEPQDFVATMAHEVSHALLFGTARTPPPGGEDAWEPATDLCAHYLGFGVFAANTSVRLRKFQTQGSQGWQVSRVGYLDEATHCYALAVFLALRDIPLKVAKPHLAANPRSFVAHALKDLARHHAARLAAMRAIGPPGEAAPERAEDAADRPAPDPVHRPTTVR